MNIPHIDHAYENIQEACIKRINEIYPHGIPAIAQERLDQELQYVRTSEYLDDFEIYRCLSIEALKCCHYFTLRGSTAGSYLIYLLGFERINPLPAHYYCPKCGYFETVPTHLYGIDLPESTCPKCGETIMGDGFHLAIESVWGIDGKKIISFDYSISKEFLAFAKNVIRKLYPENNIVPFGIMHSNDTLYIYNPSSCEMVQSGYVLLPPEQSIEDYPSLMTYLEDGEPCLSGFSFMFELPTLKRIMMIPSSYIEYLIDMQRKTGIYIYDIPIDNLRKITYLDILNSRTLNPTEDMCYSHKQPKTFMEMAGYQSLSYSTFCGFEYESTNCYHPMEQNLLNIPEFQKYPCYSRDDFFDYLLENGYERKEAFHISELIRKGRASRDPAFDDYKIPKELNILAKKYLYLFPRAHCIETLLTYARLAYYMKTDSKAYGKIVFQNMKKNK